MRTDDSPKLTKFFFGLTIGSIITLVLAFSSLHLFGRSERTIKKRELSVSIDEFLFSGFNFRKLRDQENDWKGPEIGVKINLKKLKDGRQNSLDDAIKNKTVMLVVINPSCYYSIGTKNEMNYIREQLIPLGITYYAVTFSMPDKTTDYFKFCEVLGFGNNAFQWSLNDASAPKSLTKINIPSHILVRNDGVVIQVWPGSNSNQEVRQRMAKQIVSDTLIINDAFRAIAQN